LFINIYFSLFTYPSKLVGLSYIGTTSSINN